MLRLDSRGICTLLHVLPQILLSLTCGYLTSLYSAITPVNQEEPIGDHPK